MRLRPVTYQFDVRMFDEVSSNATYASYDAASAIRRTGFIAQEVENAAQQSHYDFSGINRPASEQDHYSLSYEAFVVPLVKGMQEQQLMIEEMHKQLGNVNRELNMQRQLNQRLLKSFNDLEAQITTIKAQLKE